MSNVVYDHLGNEYATEEDMCFSYGVLTSTFNRRRRIGMTVGQALSEPDCKFITVESHSLAYKTSDGSYVDHKGNIYKSRKEMCEHWGVTYGKFMRRMDNGLGLKESLTKVDKSNVQSYYNPFSRVVVKFDDSPEHYAEIRLMREGIHQEDSTSCIETEDAQLEEDKPESYIEIAKGNRRIYHIGDEVFYSVFELQDRFGICESTIRSRIKSKWNLYDAVTKPVKPNHVGFYRPMVDHLGNEYISVGEMTMKYHISVACFNQRIDDGWSIEDALTTPMNHRLVRC